MAAADVQSPLRPLDANKEPQKKKREKLSALCKTPPALIRNKIGKDFERGLCLGEGGFARCFQVKDEGGKLYAAKTVAKVSVKSEKTRKKLLTEINIHKHLSHPNIVQFVDCFEDSTNVYILLEMCSNQSLMDMVKKRKRFTEAEARYLIVQVIGAVSYMHSRRVIHRDLKLGNIFLDHDMNAKIGDFGLATMLSDDKERKKTICGTPNYIAPEVLYGKQTGHSYEVDVWSIGIILYAMLFGKPPFQSKEVDTIYERIKTNDYAFPGCEVADVSDAAKTLITDILQDDPTKRPSLGEMLKYQFFYEGSFPSSLNPQCLTKIPNYRTMSRDTASDNFINAQVKAQLITRGSMHKHIKRGSNSEEPVAKAVNPVEMTKSVADSESKVLPNSLSPASTKDKYKMVIVNKDTKERVSSTNKLGPPGRRGDDKTNANEIKPNSAIYVKAMADAMVQALAGNATVKPQGHSRQLTQAVFVSKWVDYSNKYGLSYQLSDRQVGVLFRDKTTMIMDPDQDHNSDSCFKAFKLAKSKASKMTEWESKEVDNNDPSDAKRMKLVKSFYKYMQENLCKTDADTTSSEPVYVTQYNRQDKAVMFQLSTGAFQFNFPDHCKLIISQQGTQLDVIDPKRRITSSSLSSAVANAQELQRQSCDKYELLTKLDHCQNEIEKVWMEMVSA